MSAFGAATLLNDLPETTLASMQAWVDAALAEEKALRTYDSQLLCTKPEQLDAANRIHVAWQKWLTEAEALLARIHTSGVADKIVNLSSFRDAIGWGGCMTQSTPEDFLQGHQQAQRGETFSAEEVRRELRLANERRRQSTTHVD